jgi:hypothetical protein
VRWLDTDAAGHDAAGAFAGAARRLSSEGGAVPGAGAEQ